MGQNILWVFLNDWNHVILESYDFWNHVIPGRTRSADLVNCLGKTGNLAGSCVLMQNALGLSLVDNGSSLTSDLTDLFLAALFVLVRILFLADLMFAMLYIPP